MQHKVNCQTDRKNKISLYRLANTHKYTILYLCNNYGFEAVVGFLNLKSSVGTYREYGVVKVSNTICRFKIVVVNKLFFEVKFVTTYTCFANCSFVSFYNTQCYQLWNCSLLLLQCMKTSLQFLHLRPPPLLNSLPGNVFMYSLCVPCLF